MAEDDGFVAQSTSEINNGATRWMEFSPLFKVALCREGPSI